MVRPRVACLLVVLALIGSPALADHPQSAAGGQLAFDHVKGNEWWKPLAKQSWGGWAASFQVPSGAKVDFRARAASGATDLSGGYVWPAATPTAGC